MQITSDISAHLGNYVVQSHWRENNCRFAFDEGAFETDRDLLIRPMW